MAQNLLLLLNTIAGNLPESELRQIRGALVNSVRIADDALCNMTISTTFDMLTFNDGV